MAVPARAVGCLQAAEFEHVGPVTFDLKVVDDDKVDISISGNRNAPGRRHMMNISRANAAMEPEEMVRSATGRAIHEYFHQYQQAYGAPSWTNAGGDVTESWHFSGPRWFSEGTAEWVALVYPGLSGLKGDAEDSAGVRSRIDERGEQYRQKRAASLQDHGEHITIAQTLSPNLRDNPTWRYVPFVTSVLLTQTEMI